MTQATTLDELFEMMKRDDPSLGGWDDHLPTFGGSEPPDTAGVWSWDVDRVIVGSCSAELSIEKRWAVYGRQLLERNGIDVSSLWDATTPPHSAAVLIRYNGCEYAIDPTEFTTAENWDSGLVELGSENGSRLWDILEHSDELQAMLIAAVAFEAEE